MPAKSAKFLAMLDDLNPDQLQNPNDINNHIQALNIVTFAHELLLHIQSNEDKNENINNSGKISSTIAQEEGNFIETYLTETHILKLEALKTFIANNSKTLVESNNHEEFLSFKTLYIMCQGIIKRQRIQDIENYVTGIEAGINFLGTEIELLEKRRGLITGISASKNLEGKIGRLQSAYSKLVIQRNNLNYLLEQNNFKPEPIFLAEQIQHTKSALDKIFNDSSDKGLQRFLNDLLKIIRQAFGIKSDQELISDKIAEADPAAQRKNALLAQWMEGESHFAETSYTHPLSQGPGK